MDRMCLTSEDMEPPADSHRNSRAGGRCGTSIVVEDRAEAALLGDQRVTAVAEQVEVERLVGLLLAVAVDDNRNCLRRLAGGERQRAGPGDVVADADRGVRGPEKSKRSAEGHYHPRTVLGGSQPPAERVAF